MDHNSCFCIRISIIQAPFVEKPSFYRIAFVLMSKSTDHIYMSVSEPLFCLTDSLHYHNVLITVDL